MLVALVLTQFTTWGDFHMVDRILAPIFACICPKCWCNSPGIYRDVVDRRIYRCPGAARGYVGRNQSRQGSQGTNHCIHTCSMNTYCTNVHIENSDMRIPKCVFFSDINICSKRQHDYMTSNALYEWQDAITSKGGNLQLIWGSTLYHKDDIP